MSSDDLSVCALLTRKPVLIVLKFAEIGNIGPFYLQLVQMRAFLPKLVDKILPV